MQVFDVLLDTKTTGSQQTVSLYQGENAIKNLRITLLQNGHLYCVPSGYAAVLRGEKPDGTSLTHACQIRSGQIWYQPTAQTTAAVGTVRCQIFLYGENGALLASPEFSIDVAQVLSGVELPESADESDTPDMPTLLALCLTEDGHALCVNGEPLSVRVPCVETLPQSGAAGDVVYLTGEGLYRYADGWHKLTDDGLEAAVAALADDVDALQSAMPTAQDKTAWNSAAEDAHTHANKTALDAITAARTGGWDAAENASHTHANKSVLDDLDVQRGVLTLDGETVGIEIVNALPSEVTVGKLIFNTTGRYFHLGRRRANGTKEWLAVIDHSHLNKSVIDKISERDGRMLFDGKPIASDDEEDDVTLLSLTAYDALSLRDDFTGVGTLDDVPIYVLDNVGYGFGLYEDANDPGNCDSVSVGEVWDDDTGLPVRFVRVVRSGTGYTRWSRDCTVDGHAFSRGIWYTNNTATAAPSFAGFTPTALEVCGEWYDDLSDLPDKAASALRSLSQLVNVSAAAMGTIRVPENAVQRFAGSLKDGMHFSYTAHDDMTLDFPTLLWSDAVSVIVLDLHCLQNIELTLPREKLLDGGTLPNTTAGEHTLTFTYVPSAGKWSVGCVNREQPQYWDDIPDAVIPLEDCTWTQIKSIAEHGYLNRAGQWCIRRNNEEEVWFEIGDEKTVALSSGKTWTVQIWDFNHDDLADGSGKAPFTFGMSGVTANTYRINAINTTNGGWEACNFRTDTLPTILTLLPDALQNVLSEVSKTTCIYNWYNSYTSENTIFATTDDRLFLLSLDEIGGVSGFDRYALFNTTSPGIGTEYALRSIGFHGTRKTQVWETYGSSGQLSPTSYYLRNNSNVPDTTTLVKMRLAFCI